MGAPGELAALGSWRPGERLAALPGSEGAAPPSLNTMCCGMGVEQFQRDQRISFAASGTLPPARSPLRCRMPSTLPSSASYEFSTVENETFARLVRNLSRSGRLVVVGSLVLLGYHFISYFGVSLGKDASTAITYLDYAIWLLISMLGVVVGVQLIRATAAFAALIKTDGDDLAHLMRGMSRLADILGFVCWVAAAAASLLAVSFVLLFLYA